MKSRFLRAKHWQLFALIIGLPLIFQLILLSTTFGGLAGDFVPLQHIFFPILMITLVLTLSLSLAWFYSVGSGLQARVPPDLRRPTGLFKVALVFPTAYIILIVAVVFPLLGVMIASTIGSSFVFIIILTLHFFAMFCTVYYLYFSAKTIKLAERQESVSFSEFVGEFFLLWFFPIGIWILQPRINELVKTEVTGPANTDYV